MKRAGKARYWFVALLALGAIAGIVAWSKMRKVEAAADLPMAKARHGEFLVLVRCRGELAAERSIQLTAPVRVADLQIVWVAPPNSPVTQGQTVIRFDPSAAQQAIREHTASLRQAKANLEQAVAQARITAEQDKLDLATSQYNLEKARLDASQQAIMSEIQGAESKIDAGVAEEKLHVAQATVELHQKSSEAKIASLTRLRDQEQTELEIANHQVELMEIKTPNSGVINYLSNRSQGWLNAQPYKAGDRVFPGAVIAQVPDLATIQVEAKIDEVDRGQITPGDVGVVRIDALPEKTWTAKLAAVSPLTEQSFDWPPSRNFKAYISLDNPTAQLRPGMNASADVITARIKDAVSIPTKALFTDKGRPIVYVGTGHGYEVRVVAVEARNPDEVAVKGLAADTMVTLMEPPRNGGRK